MAKTNEAMSGATPPAPDHLTMRLHAPGMTPLHRAGLGGLVCTLRYLQQAWQACAVLEEDLPGGPWTGDAPPWETSAQSVTLHFGQPPLAREFLRRLFAAAFRIEDQLIYLPGQYGDMPPSLAVRAEIQAGLVLTFLQHGKTRGLAKEGVVVQCDPEGDGISLVTIEYRPCAWYKHQGGWEALCDEQTGCLKQEPVEVIGPLNPGAVVRHVAFTGATRIADLPERVLPLYFALVGCLALPVNRGVGVLVVPDVEDLEAFAHDRPLITPTSANECRIASAGDAALQAQVRLRQRGLIELHDLPACYAARFCPTTWASQQKSRVETLVSERQSAHRHQPDSENQAEKNLHLFAVALAKLSPRVRARKVAQTSGKGRSRQTKAQEEFFWVDSVMRPLIADNLARGRRWYQGFATLVQSRDASTKLGYEREGLQAMMETLKQSDYSAELALVQAVHEAIRKKRYRIKKDTQKNTRAPTNQATRNRQDRFMERVRLALVGAKTPDQCRAAICDLFGQALYNPRLQRDGWQQLLPLLCDRQRWQEARDLALLALASYGMPHPPGGSAPAEEVPQE
jgi:CRISPR-associated protein Cas8a1/Csx13